MKWCTYGSMGWWGWGKITKDYHGSVAIKYYEGQLYTDELWTDKPCYVKKFATMREAAHYYHEHKGTLYSLEEDMIFRFPSEHIKEKNMFKL